MTQALEIGTILPNPLYRGEMIQTVCLDEWNQVPATERMPSLAWQGRGRGGMQQALQSCTSPGEFVQADFWLLRIRPTFSGVQLPTANPHPTLPL